MTIKIHIQTGDRPAEVLRFPFVDGLPVHEADWETVARVDAQSEAHFETDLDGDLLFRELPSPSDHGAAANAAG